MKSGAFRSGRRSPAGRCTGKRRSVGVVQANAHQRAGRTPACAPPASPAPPVPGAGGNLADVVEQTLQPPVVHQKDPPRLPQLNGEGQEPPGPAPATAAGPLRGPSATHRTKTSVATAPRHSVPRAGLLFERVIPGPYTHSEPPSRMQRHHTPAALCPAAGLAVSPPTPPLRPTGPSHRTPPPPRRPALPEPAVRPAPDTAVECRPGRGPPRGSSATASSAGRSRDRAVVTSASGGTASSTVNGPTRVRRSDCTVPPQPSRSPRSRQRTDVRPLAAAHLQLQPRIFIVQHVDAVDMHVFAAATTSAPPCEVVDAAARDLRRGVRRRHLIDLADEPGQPAPRPRLPAAPPAPRRDVPSASSVSLRAPRRSRPGRSCPCAARIRQAQAAPRPGRERRSPADRACRCGQRASARKPAQRLVHGLARCDAGGFVEDEQAVEGREESGT